MTDDGNNDASTSALKFKCAARRRRRKRIREDNKATAAASTLDRKKMDATTLQLLQRRETSGHKISSCTQMSNAKKTTTHRIPFRQLATPPTEAILGLEACGSRIIGLTARHNTIELVQRGTPSPARRLSGGGAPLMKRIPLPCAGLEEGDSLVASVPVDLLLSGDVAVARIEHTATCNEDDWIGTLVLVHLETGAKATCENVRFGARMTLNHLWRVYQVPVVSQADFPKEGAAHLCTKVKRVPAGYVIINDEDDGYRLTWAIGHSYPRDHFDEVRPSDLKTAAVRHDLVVRDNTWHDDEDCNGHDRMVACEAFLSVEAVLDDIRARRKKTFYYEEHIPGFYYSLVSIDPSGRFVTLAICFSNISNKKKQENCQSRPASVAVIVKVDVYTQSYEELQWAQKNSLPNPQRLITWSLQFGQDYRRRQELRLEDTKEGCSMGAMGELYDDCVHLSNVAVRQEVPVHVLRCRSGTTELVYLDLPASSI